MVEIILKPSFKDKIRRSFTNLKYFSNEILNYDIFDGQVRYLQNSIHKLFSVLHTGNRWGKGEVALVKGCYLTLFKPVPKRFADKEVCLLNTTISQDQANIIFDKFQNNCQDKPMFSWLIKDIKHSPFPHIIFKNKVVWWFRNAAQDGKFLLGRSYLWVNIDEADFTKNLTHLVEEIIEPRTWDYGGSIDIMTTPKGKKNAYKLYKVRKDRNDSKRNYFQQGDTRENPFINQAELNHRITQMAPRLIEQNIKGEWIDAGSTISEEVIEKAQALAIGLLNEPKKGTIYINAWDLARRSTYLVGITLQVLPTIQLVNFHRSRESQDMRNPEYWHSTIAKIEQRHKIWGGKTVIDKTGLGDVVLEYIPKWIQPIGIDLGSGDGTGTRLKHAIIQNGVSMLTMGKVGLPREVEQITDEGTWTLEDELRDFEEDTRGLIWDAVCTLFLALYIINNPHFGRPTQEKEKVKPRRVVGIRGVSKHGTF